MNDIFIISYNCSINEDYFFKCNMDIQTFIINLNNGMNIHCNHHSCNREVLHKKLSEYNDNYIITIYAHGNADKVVDQYFETLIDLDDSKIYYENSIVYSTACKTAVTLGKELINSGKCKLFFGYSDDAQFSHKHKDIFVELDNYTLKIIISENTINKEYLKQKTETFFREKLNEMRMTCPIIAPMIMNNKECFQIY